MIRAALDKVSIGFSVICMIHCLVLPVLLVFTPALTSLFFNHEQFHLFLMFLVLPTSIFTLFIGCKQHRDFLVAISGIVGMLIIFFAATTLLTHNETFEKVATFVGAALIAFSHYRNMTLCRRTTCHLDHSH